jgi:hypothetical protein
LITPVFLPRYPELCKIPTNPCWYPYAKGSIREGQAPRSSNTVESRVPSPCACASGALLSAPLGRSLPWITSVFLPRYPELCKIPTNPRWYPYAKGSIREGQAPRSSNTVESHGPSPCASGALLSAPLGRSLPSPLSSFRLKHRRPRSLQYMVAAMTQTRLSRSHKTLVPLGTITTTLTRAEGLCGFSKLTQDSPRASA